MKSFTFYHITDAHTICTDEKDPARAKEAEERLLVLDTVIKNIIADKETDTVLFTGDNANNGRYNQHKEFIKHITALKEAGKKVYVTTATHDFGLTKVDENGCSEFREGVANRSELRGFYNDFGFSEAVSEFGGLSYIAKPCEGFRILMLNDDGNGNPFRGYSPAQVEWIKEQIADAKAAGDYIFAATHHPVIPPNPIYPVIGKNEMVGNRKETVALFADNGVKFVFTGHTHMHSIRKELTEKGNALYDINTGTLSEYPLKYRKVTIFDSGEADIKTVPIESVPFDTKGKTPAEYYEEKFDDLILGGIDGMANNYDEFMHRAGSLSLGQDTLLPLKTPLTLLGKILNSITYGGMGRLLFIPGKIDKSVKKKKFKLLPAELFKAVYGGDEPYSENTPEYKIIMALINRVKPFIKGKLKGTELENINEFIASVIYDPTPDGDAHLE